MEKTAVDRRCRLAAPTSARAGNCLSRSCFAFCPLETALPLPLPFPCLSSRELVTFLILPCSCTPNQTNQMFQPPPQNRHPERSASQIYRRLEGF